MRYLYLCLCLALSGCCPALTTRVSAPLDYREVLVRVTAYCAGPCWRCGTTGVTAAGKDATKGKGAAADPTWLPAGTRIYVPGYGETVVDDRGGRMKRKYWRNGVPRLDIRFQSHRLAQIWGVRYLRVKIF